MGETAKEDEGQGANPGASPAEHSDAARTTTESGASAAAGLHSVPSKTEVQANVSPTARKVNAGSSDR